MYAHPDSQSPYITANNNATLQVSRLRRTALTKLYTKQREPWTGGPDYRAVSPLGGPGLRGWAAEAAAGGGRGTGTGGGGGGCGRRACVCGLGQRRGASSSSESSELVSSRRRTRSLCGPDTRCSVTWHTRRRVQFLSQTWPNSEATKTVGGES